MSFYRGAFAEFYDRLYAEKPYAAEADFAFERATAELGRAPQTWLDVACGTGNHALHLAQRGLRVVGVDISESQLAQARLKARASGADVEFRHADMCALDLAERRFDVVSCLFDSIGYVKTNTAIVAALRSIERHLAPGGVALLEFWHAPAMLKFGEPHRVRRFTTDAGELVRISETRVDVSSQVCSVAYTLFVPGADGSYRTEREVQENRYFSVQEMALLLENAKLRVRRAYSGYDAVTPIDERTWHVVVLVGRAE